MHLDLSFISEETLTQDEFAAWVAGHPDRSRCELIEGRIVMNPPAGWPHGRLAARLVYLLEAAVEGRGLVCESSAGFELPTGDTVEPDVSYVSRARLEKGPAPEEGRFLRIVPDLVVEILSPRTQARDRTTKRRIYAESGVEEYWLVDPKAREVRVFVRRGEGRFDDGRTYVGDARIASAVLPDLSLTVDGLFRSIELP